MSISTLRTQGKNMDFFDILASRRSVRAFSDEHVTDEMIDHIIRAAMTAPSAGNQQPWHFIIVRDKEKMGGVTKFHPYAAMLNTCSVSIIVCGDPNGKKWPDFWPQDCSAAVQNMLLAARESGLGTVWVGLYPLKDRMQGMRKLFNIPSKIHPFAIVPVGFPVGGFKKLDRYDASLVHRELWTA